MPEFKVNTDELAAGRGHHHMIAGEIGGSAGLLRAAAGHSGASAAGADWGVAWDGALVGNADALRRTGDNLAAAAHAYRETDESQMRR
jgi:hypothetical protein